MLFDTLFADDVILSFLDFKECFVTGTVLGGRELGMASTSKSSVADPSVARERSVSPLFPSISVVITFCITVFKNVLSSCYVESFYILL